MNYSAGAYSQLRCRGICIDGICGDESSGARSTGGSGDEGGGGCDRNSDNTIRGGNSKVSLAVYIVDMRVHEGR